MASEYRTAQLSAWMSEFGDEYTQRNSTTQKHLSARIRLWSKIFSCFQSCEPSSVLEVGSNVGQNLQAIKFVSSAALHALEPNEKARNTLVKSGIVSSEAAKLGVAQKIPFDDATIDMVFTSGVLIHVHPDDLDQAVSEIYRVSKKFVVCVEYFSDKPVSTDYRGSDDLLFKRDFGAFYLDKFPDLRVIDYGFEWKRITSLDNLTWWIFEKN